MYYNAIATIKGLSGTASNKSLATLGTDVRILITPAGNDILALYPDLPVGQSFQFNLVSDSLSIPPEAEIKVTTAMIPDLAVNDKFIVQGESRRNRVAGQTYISGICIKAGG